MNKSRFFCKNCGAKVSASDKKCPSCRTRFISVQCPECGMKEEASFFRHGCPVCGYGKGVGEVDNPKEKSGNAFLLSLICTAIIITAAVIVLTLFVL